MTGVVAQRVVLSDSNFKTRPEFRSYLKTDNNCGNNVVRQIEEKRRIRQMKFPTLRGRKDVDSFQSSTPSTPGFKKYNDEGDHRVPAPFRSFDNIVDPVSGFVSAGGDLDRNTGVQGLKCLAQLNLTPQATIPQEVHSIRKGMRGAPPPTNRETERDPPAPYAWNSREMSERAIRAALGGWTSDVDPRKAQEEKLRGTENVPKTPSAAAKDKRDQLALKYMYTSSTQRQYEDLPWDSMLHPRLWTKPTTFEGKPDKVSQRWTIKRYEPAADEWQHPGRAWDWFQHRDTYFGNRPATFCSANPRSQQIPGYSGAVGGTNLGEIDNAGESFSPLTCKRTPLPRPTDTSHRPNIPGYKGCTWYKPHTAPAHSNMSDPIPQTTARVHRELPLTATPSTTEHKRDSRMSKMVTTVPPCNPFNKVDKEEV
ncbi:protein SPMIP7-like [Lineus longissimus]|uniref:protein SPMIP7-like n=1 Tax=Lineus longissimus TaxID=88925 RepID=UPI002B4ED825